MATLSYAEVARLAENAGFRGDRWSNDQRRYSEAAVAVAIARAESGLNPDARNPSGATGLWQVLGGSTDPQENANEAFRRYSANGRNFGRGTVSTCMWTTFCSRIYIAFIRNANVAVRQVTPPGFVQQQVQAAGQAIDFFAANPILNPAFGGLRLAEDAWGWLFKGPADWVKTLVGTIQ